jgi:hypothetical protein
MFIMAFHMVGVVVHDTGVCSGQQKALLLFSLRQILSCFSKKFQSLSNTPSQVVSVDRNFMR